MSVSKFATTTTSEEKNSIPSMVGVSRATIACTANVPSPGQLKTVSTKTAPEIKKKAVASYGANITFCEPTLAAREETLKQVIDNTGAFDIHPFDDPKVIAGQGTATLELLKEIQNLDVILTPIGGGGLICGTAIVAIEKGDAISIIGTEPRNADDAYRSFKSGNLIPQINPNTIADGLRTSLSELTFSIIQKYVTLKYLFRPKNVKMTKQRKVLFLPRSKTNIAN